MISLCQCRCQTSTLRVQSTFTSTNKAGGCLQMQMGRPQSSSSLFPNARSSTRRSTPWEPRRHRCRRNRGRTPHSHPPPRPPIPIGSWVHRALPNRHLNTKGPLPSTPSCTSRLLHRAAIPATPRATLRAASRPSCRCFRRSGWSRRCRCPGRSGRCRARRRPSPASGSESDRSSRQRTGSSCPHRSSRTSPRLRRRRQT